MPKLINKFLCTLLRHDWCSKKTKIDYDKKTQRCTVTETCCRCDEKNTYAFRKDEVNESNQ